MFVDHQPLIADYAAENPKALAHVASFAAFTVHAPFPQSIENVQHHQAGRQDKIRALGRTLESVAYLETHQETLYKRLYAIQDTAWHPSIKTETQLAYVASTVPGLGTVKAGFLLQMVFGTAGCLDVHNLRRLGIPPSVVGSIKGLKAGVRYKRVKRYLAECTASGGSENLWDSWCDFVAAERYPHLFDTGEAVSQAHVEALGLDCPF